MKQVYRLAGVLLLGAATWACGETEGAEETAIQSVAVGRGNLRITAEAVGSVEPVRRVEVKSKASGEILRLHVDVGDVVQPGTLLAEVDPRDVRNRYDQAVADLEVSQAQANNARAQLQRSEELHQAGVITDQELESSRLQFTNAQAGLTRSTTNKALAELQLGDVTIRAPMAGTILQKNVEEGTVIQSASQNVSGGTALFVMASLGEMQVRTMIDETDIGQLRPGLPTTVRVQAHADRSFQGVVEQIQPQAVVQQNVTKFPVIISLDNNEGLLKPGMNAEVEVLIDQALDVLLLDNTAIVTTQDALPAALALGLTESALDGIPMTGPLRQVGSAPAEGGGQGGGGGGRSGAGGERAPEGAAGGERTGAGVGGGERAAGQAQGGGGEGGRAGGEGGGGQAGRAGGQGGGQPAAGDQGSTEFRAFRAAGRGGGGGRGGRGGGGRGAAALASAVGAGAVGEAGTVRLIRRAVVFTVDEEGTVAPRAVDIGLSDWVRTEIVAGLEEGDRVALVGAAQLQAQQQQLNRGGGFNPLGGMVPGGGFRGGGGGPGGGGGGGGRGGL
jgi:HlyD family secretion protein